MHLLLQLLLAQSLTPPASAPGWPEDVSWGGGERSTGLPYALGLGLECQHQDGMHLCTSEAKPVRAMRSHVEPVPATASVHWLRVSGLEWQAFYSAPLGQVRLEGQPVALVRYGHPNPPHAGWEVAGPLESRAPGERVGRAVLSKSPLLHGETRAQAAMLGCPLVAMDAFPIALLFDAQGAFRMLRLQALPEQPLAELDLACVASAMEGLQVAPGTRVVELQLSLL